MAVYEPRDLWLYFRKVRGSSIVHETIRILPESRQIRRFRVLLQIASQRQLFCSRTVDKRRNGGGACLTLWQNYEVATLHARYFRHLAARRKFRNSDLHCWRTITCLGGLSEITTALLVWHNLHFSNPWWCRKSRPGINSLAFQRIWKSTFFKYFFIVQDISWLTLGFPSTDMTAYYIKIT